MYFHESRIETYETKQNLKHVSNHINKQLPFRLFFTLFIQLAELHVYLVPEQEWHSDRRLAKRNAVNECISIGFVR